MAKSSTPSTGNTGNNITLQDVPKYSTETGSVYYDGLAVCCLANAGNAQIVEVNFFDSKNSFLGGYTFDGSSYTQTGSPIPLSLPASQKGQYFIQNVPSNTTQYQLVFKNGSPAAADKAVEQLWNMTYGISTSFGPSMKMQAYLAEDIGGKYGGPDYLDSQVFMFWSKA